MRRPSRQGLLYYCHFLTGFAPHFKGSISSSPLSILSCLSIISLHLSSTAFSQEANIASEKDYIIGNHNDTIFTNFIFPSPREMPNGDSIWLQDQIVIRDQGALKKLGPYDITGFYYCGKYYEAVRLSKDVGHINKFCRRILSGRICVLTCFHVTNSASQRIATQLYFKQDGRYRKALSFNFNHTRTGRRQEIADNLRRGKITLSEFLEVVEEYNRNLEPKTSH